MSSMLRWTLIETHELWSMFSVSAPSWCSLASIGATAPFIGLFGTVWGIYHALRSISAAGSITIDRVAGPVGEALVMTAAGLAVAIPAVLAYNVFGKLVAACEAELEGFAHDLREMIAGGMEPMAKAAASEAREVLPVDSPAAAAEHPA